jgi:predicted Na+-dependent transporter
VGVAAAGGRGVECAVQVVVALLVPFLLGLLTERSSNPFLKIFEDFEDFEELSC